MLIIGYDEDKIPALQEDRERVWARALDAVSKGVITPNEAREMLGYDTRPEGDVLLAPGTMVPLTDVVNPPDPQPEP